MQFEHLATLLTVAALDGGQRGSECIASQKLISLKRELYAALYLFVYQLPQHAETHTHTACSRGLKQLEVSLHQLVLTAEEAAGRRQFVFKYSIILEYLKGPNKMQQLETNVED